MSYEVSGNARATAIGAIGLILASLIMFGQRHALKEWYFNAVLSRCKSQYGATEVTWNHYPAFDAEVRHLRNASNAEAAMITCTYRWTHLIVESRNIGGPFEVGRETLGVTISGQHYSPPERIFQIYRSKVDNDRTTLNDSENNAQTH